MLRVTFKVVRTLVKDPNTAEITIYNLGPENRARLQTKDIACSLEAGYVGNAHQIFSGTLDYGQSAQQGTDWVTTVQSGDGSKKFRSARANISLKGPVSAEQALAAAAQALGIPPGNSTGKGSLRKSLTAFAQGLVLSGKSELQVDKIMRSLGLSWSIQDGVLQTLGPTDVIGGSAVSLQPGTGLLGSPEFGEDGIVKARSLLQPELVPGREVLLSSRQVTPAGRFRVQKATFTGDTWGSAWYTDTELVPL